MLKQSRERRCVPKTGRDRCAFHFGWNLRGCAAALTQTLLRRTMRGRDWKRPADAPPRSYVVYPVRSSSQNEPGARRRGLGQSGCAGAAGMEHDSAKNGRLHNLANRLWLPASRAGTRRASVGARLLAQPRRMCGGGPYGGHAVQCDTMRYSAILCSGMSGAARRRGSPGSRIGDWFGIATLASAPPGCARFSWTVLIPITVRPRRCRVLAAALSVSDSAWFVRGAAGPTDQCSATLLWFTRPCGINFSIARLVKGPYADLHSRDHNLCCVEQHWQAFAVENLSLSFLMRVHLETVLYMSTR